MFPHRFTWDFVCPCFRRVVQDSCLRCPCGQEGRSSPGRTVPSASRPAPPRRAAPSRPAIHRPAPTGPWYVRVLGSTITNDFILLAIFLFVQPKTRTYHGRVGAGRPTAERRSEARPGMTGRRRDGSPRRRPTLLAPRASSQSKTTVLHDSSKARTNEIPKRNPM